MTKGITKRVLQNKLTGKDLRDIIEAIAEITKKNPPPKAAGVQAAHPHLTRIGP